MADPTIEIKNHNRGLAGHFWVELNDGNGTKTIGSFGPQSVQFPIGMAAASGLVPGMGNDGKFDNKDPTLNEKNNVFIPSASVVIPINQEAYAKALRRIGELQKASDDGRLDYRGAWNQNNCIDATQDIVRSAGIKENIADFFPTSISPAGAEALRRAGPRSDDLHLSTIAEFPDMAFPWPPESRSDAPVPDRIATLPAMPRETQVPVNILNSAQVAQMIPENLLNSTQYSENLLNSVAERLRAAGY